MEKKISILQKKRTKYNRKRMILKKVTDVANKIREEHLKKIEKIPSASQSSNDDLYQETQKYQKDEESGAIFLASTTFKALPN
jgi:hypothetical protein